MPCTSTHLRGFLLSEVALFDSKQVLDRSVDALLSQPTAISTRQRAAKLFAYLGKEFMWQDALRCFRLLKAKGMRPTAEIYRQLAQRKPWPIGLQLLQLQRLEAAERHDFSLRTW